MHLKPNLPKLNESNHRYKPGPCEKPEETMQGRQGKQGKEAHLSKAWLSCLSVVLIVYLVIVCLFIVCLLKGRKFVASPPPQPAQDSPPT